MRRELTEIVGDRYRLVTPREYKRAAVCGDLGIVAVLEGSVERIEAGFFAVDLRLRSGRTGTTVDQMSLAMKERSFTGASRRRISGELFTAIDDLGSRGAEELLGARSRTTSRAR